MKNSRKHSFMSVLLVCVMALTGCKVTSQETAKKEIVISKDMKWSDKMA